MTAIKHALLLLPTALLLQPTNLRAQYFPPPPNPAQFGQQAQMMNMQHAQMQSMMNNSVRVAMEAAARRAAAAAATAKTASAASATLRYEAYADPAALVRTTDTLAKDFLSRTKPGMRIAIAPTILHSLEISAKGYIVGQLLPDSLLEELSNHTSDRVSSFIQNFYSPKEGDVVYLSWYKTQTALDGIKPFEHALVQLQLSELLQKLKADVVLVPRVLLIAAGMENTKEVFPLPDTSERVFTKPFLPGLYLAVSWSTYDAISVREGRYEAAYHSAAELRQIAKRDQPKKVNFAHIAENIGGMLPEYSLAQSKRNFPYRTAQLKRLQRKKG